MIGLYWNVLTHFQNILEDIAGADGRLEYLLVLRVRLLTAFQQMDAALAPESRGVLPDHQYAFLLEYGAPGMGVDADTLVDFVALDKWPISAEELQSRLLSFGESILSKLPGDVPEAQGNTGQRQVLKAMRTWSSAAGVLDEDLSFLADKLREL